MIFEYNILDANHIVERYADVLKTTITNNKLVYPLHVAKGYIKKVVLPSAIQLLTFEYDYTQDILVKHNAEVEECYMLWFDVSLSLTPMTVSIGSEASTLENVASKTAALACSHFSFSHLRTKGANGFGVAILLHKKIMAQFIDSNQWINVLEWYFNIKGAQLHLVQITSAERTIVAELVNLTDKSYPLITLEKKIHQLLELFLLRLDKLYKERTGKLPLSANDIDVLKNIETIIHTHYMFDKVDIKNLEKKIGMTKYNLEKLCKKVLGKSLIDYIKQLKMQLAYQDVVHTEKNIREIAFDIGYANPSNFSNAFKKRFGHKPSEIR